MKILKDVKLEYGEPSNTFKDGSIQYGSRCKKCKYKDSNYCYIHEQKLSHGNFKTIPNKMIKPILKKNSTIEKNV